MNFYRLKEDGILHAFGDPISDLPIADKTLAYFQQKFIKQLGGELRDINDLSEIKDPAPHMIFSEKLYFSYNFLKSAVERCRTSSNNLQFALERNSFNQRFVLPHPEDTTDLHLLPIKYVQNEKGAYSTTIINQKVFTHKSYLPPQILKGEEYHMDQCDTFASHIASPFHLLFVNLAINLSRAIPLQSKLPRFLKERFGHPGSKWFYRGLKRLNRIGKNCKIHPSAIIEGSVLGDGVTVGANSIVRMSTLGDGVYVSDNVSVINSVLGDRTFIANSNYINSCFTYEEVFLIHGPYQLSIFGKNAACFAVINCDIRLDQNNIKIETEYGIMDSNQALLGIAYGHRSKTGGGNIIAAGRIVPNDLHINPPDSIILNFEKS